MSVRRTDVLDAIRTELALSAKIAREWSLKEAPLRTRPTGMDPPGPPPAPTFPAPSPDNLAAIAELQRMLKNERAGQLEAARRLADQAKAARAEAKAARLAEKAAAAQLSEATKEARERARLEKLAEIERKRLEKGAMREAREAAAALKAAEVAALREGKEAEKEARASAVQEVKEAKEAEKAAKEARRGEEQRERELRDAQRKQQQDALAAARAEEQLRKSLKRKAEVEAREAAGEAKRARVRQDQCDETMRQIHFLRDEMETVGERAEELLGKLVGLDCSTPTAELVWIRRLVDEAIAWQDRLMAMIEAAEIDWQTKQHAEIVDEEDLEEEDDDESESSEGEEDEGGVRVGQFGSLEVVADEADEEGGADAFDEREYQQAMADLRRGRMRAGDLQGMDLNSKFR